MPTFFVVTKTQHGILGIFISFFTVNTVNYAITYTVFLLRVLSKCVNKFTVEY